MLLCICLYAGDLGRAGEGGRGVRLVTCMGIPNMREAREGGARMPCMRY